MDGLETVHFFNQKRESEQHTNIDATVKISNETTLFYASFGEVREHFIWVLNAEYYFSQPRIREKRLLAVIQTDLKVSGIIKPIKTKSYTPLAPGHTLVAPCVQFIIWRKSIEPLKGRGSH